MTRGEKLLYKPTMRLSRYIKHLDMLIAAVAGYLAVHVFTNYSGVGISPDSIMYASTAESIYSNGNLTTFNGTPLTFFPVFYPAFLSVFFLFADDLISIAPVINGLLFASAIFLCGCMADKLQTRSIIYKWLLLAAIVLSPALLEIYSYLWSETLFVLTILLFIFSFRYYLLKRTLQTLVIASFMAALCCLTRYAGLAVIATGILLIIADRGLVARKKVSHMLVFGFTGISFLAVNILVNTIKTGLGTGERKPSVTSFAENLYHFGTVICDWLGLKETAYPYGSAITIIILLILITISALNILNKKLSNYETLFAVFGVVYSLFILTVASISRFEQISSRLLSPVFIPMLIGCTAWIPDAFTSLRVNKRAIIAIPVVLLMLGFLYNILLIDLKRYDDEFDYGVPGYTDDDWNRSAFVVFIKTHKDIYKPGVTIYSDADEAVYFFSGMRAKLLPHRYFKNDVAKFYGEKHFYLVWFKALAHPELIGLEDIQRQKKLVKLYDLEDGAVYEYKE